MNYEIYRLSFSSPVHFGSGRLTGTNNTVCADTLFSALCIEAVRLYGDEGAARLYSAVAEGGLRLSDTFPYCSDTLLIPKPIISVDNKHRGNSRLKKEFKSLKYIPIEDIDLFLSGEYNPSKVNIRLSELGREHDYAKVSVKVAEDNLPYNVGTYTYADGCGIYFIAAAEAEDSLVLIEELTDSLSYTGIGGKVSSGYGKFDYVKADMPQVLRYRLEHSGDTYMSLSVALPKESELSEVMEGASYELIKRSGFVASDSYSDMPVRRRDLYCFKSGSCFKCRFDGDIYDVSGVKGGRHRVYRYAVPLFIAIEGVR